jgi:hypothetical protein
MDPLACEKYIFFFLYHKYKNKYKNTCLPNSQKLHVIILLEIKLNKLFGRKM